MIQKRSGGAFALGVGTAMLLAWSTAGCGDSVEVPQAGVPEQTIARNDAPLPAQTVEHIKTFCGDCHPFPQPDTFPKDHWEEEIIQGYDFYITSGRTDLPEPSREDTIRYYVNLAPDEVRVPRADERAQVATAVRFERLQMPMPSVDKSGSISHVVRSADQRTLYTADMRRGTIDRWSVGDDGSWQSETIGKGRNACRLTPCDLNADGREDLLVGEIGSYGVGDHSRGRVSALVQREDGGFDQRLLAQGLARVVECAPIDYEGDGDLDILVAEFGWLETGALKLLRNVAEETQAAALVESQLEVEVIDPRHGPLGVRVLDMNDDGQQDFVVAYGQEYESLEIWFGEGGGRYRHEVILELPDPSYNSSSFEVVDVDQDGRLDIVHTNGDTLDAFLPKPYHGVRWLRNLGDGKWERRELGLLIGALQALVADWDQDGDLDIAAVGMYPFGGDDPGAYDSICWWEQREGMEFVQHTIERDNCDYASLVSHDVDGDGRLDVVLGNWTVGPNEDRLRVYRNIVSGDARVALDQ